MSEFPWDAIVEPIVGERNVVAVVGEGLLDVEFDGRATTVNRLLAERLLRRTGLPTPPAGTELAEVLFQLSGRRGTTVEYELHRAHQQLLTELREKDALPRALRTLSQITDLRLFLSTTTDGAVEEALKREGRTDTKSFSTRTSPEAEQKTLLAHEGTLVVQMFGRISASGGFALSEEDVMEQVAAMQGATRPAALLDYVAKRHVLLIGTRFPDWLARLFLRTLRGVQLSKQSMLSQALADERAREQPTLVSFLNNFSPRTLIFEDGSPTRFVEELHRRWRDASGAKASGTAIAGGVPEPLPMQRGAVFISYSRQDSVAAQNLFSVLGPKVDVWFDQRKLDLGDPWAQRIRENIENCDLFLPVLSRNTYARNEGFFIQEWRWADSRNQRIKGRPFIVPVVVDELAFKNIPPEFSGNQIASAPNGHLTPEQVDRFIVLIREVRAGVGMQD